VSVEGIWISYGEAYPDVYIQHIGRELDHLGLAGIPLGSGQDSPLAGTNEFPEGLRDYAGKFWGLPIPNPGKVYPAQSAPEMIASIVNRAPEPVTIFVSGPSTNLAQALRLDPDIRNNIAAVYIMGGSVYAPGNIHDLLPDRQRRGRVEHLRRPGGAEEVFESGMDLTWSAGCHQPGDGHQAGYSPVASGREHR
jgi:inosine-uridine nucleoside N-ribohydrolase